jgi:hypothetical protein
MELLPSHRSLVNDYYFSSDLPEPGADIPIQISGPRYGPSVVRGRTLRIPAHATAEYVQFLDGTFWGNADTVEEALKVRELTIRKLKAMQNAYEEWGIKGLSLKSSETRRRCPQSHLYKTYTIRTGPKLLEQPLG